jgi:hypothetical protein
MLDSTLLWGVPNQGDGTIDNPSMTGGLINATTTHTASVSGALELVDIIDLLQDIAEDVGADSMGKQLMMGYQTKRILNSFFKENRRYTGREDVRLNETGFESDFGKIEFVLNHKMKDDARIIILNPNDWEFVWFEGGSWSDGLYSSDGWYDTGFLRCDFGTIWAGDRRRGMITGFSLDTDDYPNIDLI